MVMVYLDTFVVASMSRIGNGAFICERDYAAIDQYWRSPDGVHPSSMSILPVKPGCSTVPKFEGPR
jgi:hypothetical protein